MLTQLQTSVSSDDREAQAANKARRERLEKRLSDVRRRVDQAYIDKLDGKIAEDFWQRQTADWQREEQQIAAAIATLAMPNQERVLTAQRTFELANKAYFLYLTQNPAEQARLLRMVL